MMKKQVVRCMYCQRRYNVSGCMPGTRLRCGGCERILVVPKFQASGPPKLWQMQKPALLASAGGFVIALALFMVVTRKDKAPVTTPEPVVAAAPDVIPRDSSRPVNADVYKSQQWEKKLRSVRTRLREDFGNNIEDRFTFYPHWQPFYFLLEKGHVSLSDVLTRDYLPRVKAVHDHLMSQFGSDLGWSPNQDVLTLVVLNSKESFESYWTRVHHYPPLAEVKGDFNRDGNCAVVYYDPVDGTRAAVHEMVHHIFNVYMAPEAQNRIRPNAWFEEGMASYFEYEYLAYEKGQLHSVKLDENTYRIEELKDAELIPLARFVAIDARQISSQHSQADGGLRLQQIYSEACALIHFLRNNPLYRRQLTDYLGRYLRGEVDKDTFVKCFGDTDTVERDFKKFLQDKIH